MFDPTPPVQTWDFEVFGNKVFPVTSSMMLVTLLLL